MDFDLITGQPINQGDNQQMNFDPITGQRLGDSINNSTFDNNRRPKNTIKIVIIALCIIAVFVVAAIALLPKMLLGKNEKIIIAMENTFKPSYLMEEVGKANDVIMNGKYTMEANFSNKNNTEEKVLFSYDSGEKSAFVNCDINDYNFKSFMNDKEILLYSPNLEDHNTIRYGINEKKTGYITEVFETAGMDIEEFDKSLSNFLSNGLTKEAMKINEKATFEVLKTIEFEDGKKETFKIDGKDRELKGYYLKINKSLLNGIVNIYKDNYKEYLKNNADVFKLADVDPDDIFYSIKSELKERLGDSYIDLNLYLYNNKIAVISLEPNGDKEEEVIIEFKGDKIPWQKTTVTYSDDKMDVIDGKTDGDKEKYEYSLGGSSFEYSYDKKTGDFEINSESMDLEGKITNKDKFTMSIDKIKSYGYNLGEATISIDKKFTKEKIDSKDAFDLGNADEDEIDELMNEIFNI